MVLFGVGQSVLMAQKDLLGLYHWIFFMLLPSVNYAVFPVVQTLATPDLRHHFVSREPWREGLVSLFDVVANAVSWVGNTLCSKCTGGHGGDVEAGVEMGGVGNGIAT